MEKKKHIDFVVKIIMGGLTILTVLGIVKSIWISSDIDEAYAVAQSYRWLRGDHFILNMWEPHQLSAYFCAVFMKVFIFISGTTTGIVIYLRCVGTFIHFLLGMCLYKVVNKKINRMMGWCALLLHMNYLAKWLTIPEFELISYWCLLGSLLCAGKYIHTKKNRWLVILGILILGQMLNYPTMILLYPVYLIGMAKCCGWSVKRSLYITLGAAIPGIMLLLYFFSYMNMDEFLVGLAHITADPSHMEVSLGSRMLSYGKELLIDLSILFGGFVIAYLASFWKKTRKERTVSAFLMETTVYECVHIIGCLLFDQNQFFLQERYLLFCIFAIVVSLEKRKEKDFTPWIYFGMVPAIVAVVAACLLSNMTLGVAYSKLFLCVIVVLVFLWSEQKERDAYCVRIDFAAVPFLLGIMGLLVCKLLLIRVTGCLPVTVKAPMIPITDGPAKGIYMLADQAEILNENCMVIKQNVHSDDKFFYFGCENLSYLYTDAEICAASVQGTSVFNQDFLDYFTLFPEKRPNVIAVDKSFEMIEAYRYSPWNYIVKDWIEAMNYEPVAEGNYIIIYRQP